MTATLTYVLEQRIGPHTQLISFGLADMTEAFTPDELDRLADGNEVTGNQGQTYRLVQAHEQPELFG